MKILVGIIIVMTLFCFIVVKFADLINHILEQIQKYKNILGGFIISIIILFLIYLGSR